MGLPTGVDGDAFAVSEAVKLQPGDADRRHDGEQRYECHSHRWLIADRQHVGIPIGAFRFV